MVPYDIFMPFPCIFQLFSESDTLVEQKFEILRISNFCFSFHTFPCMESYGSMHFHVWNHMIPCVELHGRSVGHGSMHGILWNHTDHMLPCMELGAYYHLNFKIISKIEDTWFRKNNEVSF